VSDLVPSGSPMSHIEEGHMAVVARQVESGGELCRSATDDEDFSVWSSSSWPRCASERSCASDKCPCPSVLRPS
jgi:hypothetical protein